MFARVQADSEKHRKLRAQIKEKALPESSKELPAGLLKLPGSGLAARPGQSAKAGALAPKLKRKTGAQALSLMRSMKDRAAACPGQTPVRLQRKLSCALQANGCKAGGKREAKRKCS